LPCLAERSSVIDGEPVTSERSVGAISIESLSTLPKSKRVGSVIHVIGWLGTVTGVGRNPASVPIYNQLGPAGLRLVSGVGKTLGSI